MSSSSLSILTYNLHLRPSSYDLLQVEESRDVLGVDVQSDAGKVRLVSVYNPCSTAEAVPGLLFLAHSPPSPSLLLASGDFNASHPLWNPSCSAPTASACELADLLSLVAPEMLLPPGTVTRRERGSESAIDLVASSAALSGRVLSCEVATTLDSGSDHLPILTLLDLHPRRRVATLQLNFKLVDSDALQEAYLQRVRTRGATDFPLTSPASLDDAVDLLQQDLHHAITRTVPPLRTPGRAQPWWSPKLAAFVKDARRARNLFLQRQGDPQARLLALNAVKKKKAAIAQAKRQYLERFLARITADSLWPSLRQLSCRSAAGIPPLKRTDGSRAVTFAEKTNLLHSSFIPRRSTPTHPLPTQ
ncbi:hypothetical protein JCM11641_007010 [Rhodosporidiobolus odoratus]